MHAWVYVSVISIERYCLRRYRLCYNVRMIVKQKKQKAQWTKKKFSPCGSLGPLLNVSFIIIFIIVYVIPLSFRRYSDIYYTRIYLYRNFPNCLIDVKLSGPEGGNRCYVLVTALA